MHCDSWYFRYVMLPADCVVIGIFIIEGIFKVLP